MNLLRSALPLVGAAFVLLAPLTTSAHALQPASATVVQELGPYQLAATMSVPSTLPGLLSVQIAPEQTFPGVVAVTLWVVPAGGLLPTPPPARVISAQGTVVDQFPINDPWDYELALQVAGQDGGGEARVPLTVVQPPLAWVPAVIPAALGGFVLIRGGATVSALRMRGRGQSVSARTHRLLSSSMGACGVIALVAVLATQFMPPAHVVITVVP